MLNSHGRFTLAWWGEVYPILRAWRATRPYPRPALTARFLDRTVAMGNAWQRSCAPYLDDDIEMVTWEQVHEFADVVGGIKPTRSPVFRSKLSHFCFRPSIRLSTAPLLA